MSPSVGVVRAKEVMHGRLWTPLPTNTVECKRLNRSAIYRICVIFYRHILHGSKRLTTLFVPC